jgi:hypothetical protein
MEVLAVSNLTHPDPILISSLCAQVLPGNSLPMRRMTADDTANMITVTAKPPAERRRQVESLRSEAHFESRRRLQNWQVQIDGDMQDHNARVLPPPSPSYSGGKKPNMGNGYSISLGHNELILI